MRVLRAWDVNLEGHTRGFGVQVSQNELPSFLHRRRQSQHLHLGICVGVGRDKCVWWLHNDSVCGWEVVRVCNVGECQIQCV